MNSAPRIAVLGAGYVGLTTAVCLASLGNRVTCYDHDHDLVAALGNGVTRLDEPDLRHMLRQTLNDNALHFTTDLTELDAAQFTMMCLPTPPRADGSTDLSALDTVLELLRHRFAPDSTLIIRSTVPVGTHRRVRELLARDDITVVSNPEFLREGHAIYDFLHPARIVLGATDLHAARRVQTLFDPIPTQIIHTTPATAELAKYAANAYLAIRLSFVNSLARLSDTVDADIDAATRILAADHRIGPDYLKPGPGWGGPCLPKDITSLAAQSQNSGTSFASLRAAITDNIDHQLHLLDRLRNELHGLRNRRIAILGLTFKSGTNDRRDSPAESIARQLLDHGARVTAHDPTVQPGPHSRPPTVASPYHAARSADAIVLLTDWPHYKALDWAKIARTMLGTVVFDTRNYLDPAAIRSAGLRYLGNGRSATKFEDSSQPAPVSSARSVDSRR